MITKKDIAEKLAEIKDGNRHFKEFVEIYREMFERYALAQAKYLEFLIQSGFGRCESIEFIQSEASKVYFTALKKAGFSDSEAADLAGLRGGKLLRRMLKWRQ